jgi:hypothetical protein
MEQTQGRDEQCSGREADVSHAARVEKAAITLEGSLQAVMVKLAEEATDGSVSHMKLLLQLLGLEDGALSRKPEGPKEKTLEEILMEQWRNEP